MIRVFSDKKVPPNLVNVVKTLLPYIKKHIKVIHYVPIYLVHVNNFTFEGTKRKAYACFVIREKDNKPMIFIATKSKKALWKVILNLLEALVHEFIHYEQYRQGCEPTERGVAKKTSKICNQILKEVLC
jgi:hypothetical protein